MVKICPNTYPAIEEEMYKEYFEKYPYPLSSFQKYALEAIVRGHHILVTAHTGSGKTLPAEFAIEYFVSRGKKVIYTSPIKALSNQKYYEFTQKFPHISFGILTGDIKTNPEADVLIMTTEILQNTLYRKKHASTNATPSLLMFDIDMDSELACVVFDEVHYINDSDRGKVWEETIMMLPLHIQMVMLSATLDAPEKFALWCETRGIRGNQEKKRNDTEAEEAEETEEQNKTEEPNKTVYLTTTYERVVPLTHYSFITATQGIFKAIKDKELEQQIRSIINKPHVIQSSKGEFNEIHYHKMKNVLDLVETKKVFVKRSHVINQVCQYMVENTMLPAICFVLSRRQLEVCAKEVTTILLEDDSKVPYIIQRECEQIIRKLPNFQEYLELPEYNDMVALLQKGIAIHHAGIMPILREMVELLFAKGYVKLLFATETFAVGINMPTKTVVFTDVNKFDGSNMRMLLSHEFTQMAGRAGRRGIDTVGNVIHLNNLFKNVSLTEYRTMMQGKPQRLVSKFKISYNLLLNLICIGEAHFLRFVQRSMIQEDIESHCKAVKRKIADKEKEIGVVEASFPHLRTPVQIVQQYIQWQDDKKVSVNKRRKEVEREIQKCQDEYRFIENDVKTVSKYNGLKKELDDLNTEFIQEDEYLNTNILIILEFLEQHGFIEKTVTATSDATSYALKTAGFIATHVREIHCLTFAKLLESGALDALDTRQLMAIFSCFTNVTVSDEYKSLHVPVSCEAIQPVIHAIVSSYGECQDFETKYQINTGVDYAIHYDLMEYVTSWAGCDTTQECKYVLQGLENEKGIFLGEFVKAIMKINNIAAEMEKIAESIGNIALLNKLREIPRLTQKFVATNQSLYV